MDIKLVITINDKKIELTFAELLELKQQLYILFQNALHYPTYPVYPTYPTDPVYKTWEVIGEPYSDTIK